MVKGLNLCYDDLSVKYYHDQVLAEFLELFEKKWGDDFTVNRLEQIPHRFSDLIQEHCFSNFIQDYLKDNKLAMIDTLAQQEHGGRCIAVLEFYNMQKEVWELADYYAKFDERCVSACNEIFVVDLNSLQKIDLSKLKVVTFEEIRNALRSTPSEKRALWRKIKKDLKIKRNITNITNNQYVRVLYYIRDERAILNRRMEKTILQKIIKRMENRHFYKIQELN